MNFDIDVSGNDLLSKNYTICIADKNGVIKGFKFDNKIIKDLCSRISLDICRDFYGRENDIKKNILFFLENKLKLNLGDRIYFTKLSNDSNAHKYSYLMRHDTKNKMQIYIKISLKDFEKWLKK